LAVYCLTPAAKSSSVEAIQYGANARTSQGLWCQNPAEQCKVMDDQGKCDVIRGLHASISAGCGCDGKTSL
jgi:hypothetical protein